jgi:hypothetical protein
MGMDDPKLPKYAVPVKGGGRKIYPVLPPLSWGHAWDDGDLRQIVLDSFRAHGKQMTDTATAKADNTESYLRYLLRARELL